MHFICGQIQNSLYCDLQYDFHIIELYKTAEGFEMQYVKTDHLSMCSEAKKIANLLFFVHLLHEHWSISSYVSLLLEDAKYAIIEGRLINQAYQLNPKVRQ